MPQALWSFFPLREWPAHSPRCQSVTPPSIVLGKCPVASVVAVPAGGRGAAAAAVGAASPRGAGAVVAVPVPPGAGPLHGDHGRRGEGDGSGRRSARSGARLTCRLGVKERPVAQARCWAGNHQGVDALGRDAARPDVPSVNLNRRAAVGGERDRVGLVTARLVDDGRVAAGVDGKLRSRLLLQERGVGHGRAADVVHEEDVAKLLGLKEPVLLPFSELVERRVAGDEDRVLVLTEKLVHATEKL